MAGTHADRGSKARASCLATSAAEERLETDRQGLLKVWLTPGLLHRCGARKDVDMPKIYNEQFKADAVALVESGMSRRQVCADLGV